jgi:hypothetical protein
MSTIKLRVLHSKIIQLIPTVQLWTTHISRSTTKFISIVKLLDIGGQTVGIIATSYAVYTSVDDPDVPSATQLCGSKTTASHCTML